MGGYVVLAFAQKYTQYVDALTLISSHPFEDSMTQVLARTRESELLEEGKKHLLLMSFANKNFANCTDPLLKQKINTAVTIALEQSDEGMMADLSGMMTRADLSGILQDSRFPVKIVYGLNDAKMPVRQLESLKSDFTAVQSVENAGHLCIIERPEIIAEMIRF
jgi:pimeloyl-ACP methyl ester carboxylesterase